MAYNLYADKLLGLDLFPQSIYDTRTCSQYSRLTPNFLTTSLHDLQKRHGTPPSKVRLSSPSSPLSLSSRLTYTHPHAGTYGIPLDTRHTYTKSDWQIWMAAALDSTSTTVRDTFITGVYAYLSAALGGNKEPTSDWYDTVSGVTEGFRARPVVGGHLALVSLCFLGDVLFGFVGCVVVFGVRKSAGAHRTA